jgi:short-subunit dehydrogenase
MPKVILITGAASGIGRAIGDHLSSKGFNVYGTSRNPQNADNTISFPLLKLDLADHSSIKKAFNVVISKEGRLDVLVNNAGAGITGPIEETPNDEIKKAFQTNFFGSMDMIKTALPIMRKQGSGLIINITSVAGYMGLPYRGIYSASKAALEITTEALRMELKQFGIKLTNIAPGDFATNIAAGRYHSPVLEDSPYKEQYKDTLNMMNEHVDSGEDPIKVAHKVYQVIHRSNPRVRYTVGAFLQKMSIVLKRILPGKVYEKMIMNHYNLK